MDLYRTISSVARGWKMFIILALLIRDADSTCSVQNLAELAKCGTVAGCQSLPQIKECLTPLKKDCKENQVFKSLDTALIETEKKCNGAADGYARLGLVVLGVSLTLLIKF